MMKQIFDHQDRFIIAKNAYSANLLLKRIEQGRAPTTLLFSSEVDAAKRFSCLSEMKREEERIFKVQLKEK